MQCRLKQNRPRLFIRFQKFYRFINRFKRLIQSRISSVNQRNWLNTDSHMSFVFTEHFHLSLRHRRRASCCNQNSLSRLICFSFWYICLFCLYQTSSICKLCRKWSWIYRYHIPRKVNTCFCNILNIFKSGRINHNNLAFLFTLVFQCLPNRTHSRKYLIQFYKTDFPLCLSRKKSWNIIFFYRCPHILCHRCANQRHSVDNRISTCHDTF